jgi:Cd2+/Zn2+-exporting ATPase
VLLALSRRTLQIIHMNLLAGFVFIVLAIIASSLGWVTPIVAAFIHELGAFFVLFNSARLLRFEEDAVTAPLEAKA